jgi:hypothetical protein
MLFRIAGACPELAEGARPLFSFSSPAKLGSCPRMAILAEGQNAYADGGVMSSETEAYDPLERRKRRAPAAGKA